mgnify:CR=1 FL=1
MKDILKGCLELRIKEKNNVIIIYGMPATGKSMISVVLADEIKKNMQKKVFLISGDKLANIYYGGAHTDYALNLKYKNFEGILENILEVDADIVIEDFFKRSEDFYKIKKNIDGLNRNLVIIRIQCALEERIIRDSFRDSGNELGLEKMLIYQKKYEHICKGLPYDICFDSGKETIDSIVKEIEGLIGYNE